MARKISWAVSVAMVAAGLGCHHPTPQQQEPTTQPTTAPASLAADQQPNKSLLERISDAFTPSKPKANAAGVAPKPFIAWPQIGASDQPSVVLLAHARTDSPVPLSQFSRQKTYTLSAFGLRGDLSLDAVQSRLGPPAQWADYSDLWVVYRLDCGKELWLHFAAPMNDHLLAADVISAAEDGYVRERVFSANRNAD